MKVVVAVLGLVLSSMSFAVPYVEGVGEQAQIQEGKDYEVLAAPGPTEDPSKIEVREFFYYGCPHCFRLEKPLKVWSTTLANDVYITKTPGALTPKWEPLARAFYIAVAMDIIPKIDTPLFSALHLENRSIYTRDSIQEFFAEKAGVSKEQFDKAYENFSIVQQVKNSEAMARQYRLTGVPTFIINGKYKTSVSMTGSEERLFVVMNALIQKERGELQAKK